MLTMNNTATNHEISLKTISLVGLDLDVYGLDEMQDASEITCLWLLHPRTFSRTKMGDFARLVVREWTKCPRFKEGHGLIAIAFDLLNHGSRMTNEERTWDWAGGNENHAIDLLNMVTTGKMDLSALIDRADNICHNKHIKCHLTLGWSLGGHVAWQAWLWDERISGAAIILLPSVGIRAIKAPSSRDKKWT